MEEVATATRKPTAKLQDEAREDQLIALAIDLAERQLREGKASSQVICHYLKLASSKDRLEKELLAKQVELAAAKTEMLQSAKRTEELYLNALNAMKSYSGRSEESDDDEFY